MRLLNTSSINIYVFSGDEIPEYAILSHTWGDEEVSLQELDKDESRAKAGYSKIQSCCALANLQGWQYVWIDTCCIDKSSSAELSEAINSMFRWYRDAKVCYAYLEDVAINSHEDSMVAFRKSRWFTRGWTLQELLAVISAQLSNDREVARLIALAQESLVLGSTLEEYWEQV